VKIQVIVFRVVTPCGIAVRYPCFRGSCCLHLQSALKMEAARSSETLVSNHHTTRRNNQENHELYLRNKKILLHLYISVTIKGDQCCFWRNCSDITIGEENNKCQWVAIFLLLPRYVVSCESKSCFRWRGYEMRPGGATGSERPFVSRSASDL